MSGPPVGVPPRPPRLRRRPRPGRRALAHLLSGWLAVTALAVVVAVVLVVAFLLPARRQPSLKGLTPQQILQTSLAAAGRSGSFHLSLLGSDGGPTQVATGDISAAGGTMSSTTGGEPLSLLSVGGTEYFKAGTQFWAAAPGIAPGEAALLGGRWLSMPVGDTSPLAQIGDVLQTANVLNEILDLSGPLTEQAVDSTTGTVTLTGTIPTNKLTDGSGAGDQGTLVISARSPFLPVSLSYSDAQNGGTQLEFTNWGEKVALSAPGSSVPLSQLNTGSGAASAAAAARQAQMNLRNTLTAELTYFTSNQQFVTSSPAALSQLIPSLHFVTTGAVTPGTTVLLSADHDAVVMTAAAANGNCYSIESIADPGGPVPVGTYYYQAPGSGQGGRTACPVPSKLVESRRAAPSNPSAAASPGTWSLDF